MKKLTFIVFTLAAPLLFGQIQDIDKYLVRPDKTRIERKYYPAIVESYANPLLKNTYVISKNVGVMDNEIIADGCHSFRIHKNWLLTAAHCIPVDENGFMSIDIYDADRLAGAYGFKNKKGLKNNNLIIQLTPVADEGGAAVCGITGECARAFFFDVKNKTYVDVALVYLPYPGKILETVSGIAGQLSRSSKKEDKIRAGVYLESVKAADEFFNEMPEDFYLLTGKFLNIAKSVNKKPLEAYNLFPAAEKRVYNFSLAAADGETHISLFFPHAFIPGLSGSPVFYGNTVVAVSASVRIFEEHNNEILDAGVALTSDVKNFIRRAMGKDFKDIEKRFVEKLD